MLKFDKHSPQNILIIFGREMGYLPLRSPVHPMVSADSNGRSTDFPTVFLLHIFRLPVSVNYFGRHLHHQARVFRQDSRLSYFATIQACRVSFLSRCSPFLTDPILRCVAQRPDGMQFADLDTRSLLCMLYP